MTVRKASSGWPVQMAIDVHAIKAERQLPSPGGAAQRVLRLLSDDSATIGALAHALEADPALSRRVLKLANSAVFSGRPPVVALADAAQRIGVNALRQVLVSFSLVDRYRRGHCDEFDYQAFWSQSLATAVVASHLATLVTMVPAAGDCFALGLLARTGELGLATLHPESYGALHHALTGASAERIVLAERVQFAVDRYALAERLLREWQLPDAMGAAVGACGDPALSGLPTDSASMRLARLLQIAVRLGALFDSSALNVDAGYLLRVRRLCEVAGIPFDALNRKLPDVIIQWREWGSTFGLDIRGSAPSTLETPAADAEIIPFPRPAVDGLAPLAADANSPGTSAPDVPTAAPAVAPVANTQGTRVDADARRAAGGRVAARSIGAAAARPPAGVAPVSLRILLVHPDLSIAQSWTALMRSQGHDVRQADRGDLALGELMREPPQVVLCDLGIKDMDALALCRSVRSSRPGRELYLIATGPREHPGALESAFGAGADDFINTPFQAGELLARLRAARRFIDMQDQLLADREEVRRLATALSLVNVRLEEAAETDPLTGIANRRRANDHLSAALRQAEELGQPLGVFLIDLDHFKRVNDTWGHATGDEVLKLTARTLQAYLRTSDLVARFGGEEFLVIAPGTAAPAAAALAERLRAGVARLRIPAGKDQIVLTFSVGVAVYDPGAGACKRTPEALLHMADEALYRAKDSGRNRVCLAADRAGPAPSDPASAEPPAAQPAAPPAAASPPTT